MKGSSDKMAKPWPWAAVAASSSPHQNPHTHNTSIQKCHLWRHVHRFDESQWRLEEACDCCSAASTGPAKTFRRHFISSARQHRPKNLKWGSKREERLRWAGGDSITVQPVWKTWEERCWKRCRAVVHNDERILNCLIKRKYILKVYPFTILCINITYYC